MKKLVKFNSRDEFIDHVADNALFEIGEGSEGEVYLTYDNNVIKNMLDSINPKKYIVYNDLIMDDELKLDSFIFPKELYLLKGIIVGYKENYFANNIFDNPLLPNEIDIDKLVVARKKFIEDTKAMTDAGYRLYELPGNLLFDNNRLVAIDTLDYIKNDDITLDENIKIVDYAILLALLGRYSFIDCRKTFDSEIEKVYEYRK